MHKAVTAAQYEDCDVNTRRELRKSKSEAEHINRIRMASARRYSRVHIPRSLSFSDFDPGETFPKYSISQDERLEKSLKDLESANSIGDDDETILFDFEDEDAQTIATGKERVQRPPISKDKAKKWQSVSSEDEINLKTKVKKPRKVTGKKDTIREKNENRKQSVENFVKLNKAFSLRRKSSIEKRGIGNLKNNPRKMLRNVKKSTKSGKVRDEKEKESLESIVILNRAFGLRRKRSMEKSGTGSLENNSKELLKNVKKSGKSNRRANNSPQSTKEGDQSEAAAETSKMASKTGKVHNEKEKKSLESFVKLNTAFGLRRKSSIERRGGGSLENNSKELLKNVKKSAKSTHRANNLRQASEADDESESEAETSKTASKTGKVHNENEKKSLESFVKLNTAFNLRRKKSVEERGTESSENRQRKLSKKSAKSVRKADNSSHASEADDESEAEENSPLKNAATGNMKNEKKNEPFANIVRRNKASELRRKKSLLESARKGSLEKGRKTNKNRKDSNRVSFESVVTTNRTYRLRRESLERRATRDTDKKSSRLSARDSTDRAQVRTNTPRKFDHETNAGNLKKSEGSSQRETEKEDNRISLSNILKHSNESAKHEVTGGNSKKRDQIKGLFEKLAEKLSQIPVESYTPVSALSSS